ncbi:hypothetical protein KRP22_007968 [Phytophthora ramorum]|nr:hypothetical protein KRP22_4021 [Phytophthora ramorum]
MLHGFMLLHGGILPGLGVVASTPQEQSPRSSSSFRSQLVTSSGTAQRSRLGWLRVPQLNSAQNAICAPRRTTRPPLSPPATDAKTMPPKPATKDADDAQKQRQTNLEIDLLKSAWIQKDRESPPNTGKK